MNSQFKIAGVMSVKNYADDCRAFEALKALSDVTIVLDHNSTQPFPFRDECNEYLVLKNRELWNDVGNSTSLFYRAYVHGCRWIVWMDDDLIFSNGFQTRSDVIPLLEKMQAEKADVCVFTLRDLWESKEHCRMDGVWGRKAFTVIRRNWFFDENLTLRSPEVRLHSPIFPRNKKPHQIWAEHVVYHTGCFTQERRVRRVEKYRVEDPENKFQRDYTYMLKGSCLQIESVPEPDRSLIQKRFRPELRDNSQ